MKLKNYYTELDIGKAKCLLCPRKCILREDQIGHCRVRKNISGKIELITYGKPCGLAVDPVEKKPLYHFYPGSDVLSFGTFGCNLDCSFCQNHHLSDPAPDYSSNLKHMGPKDIVNLALRYKSKSIAFTYNEPIVFFEFARTVAKLARAHGIKVIAVTSGYIAEDPREEFFSFIDAVNIDLKAFSNSFYQKFCNAKLDPVLDTLRYVVNETNVWTEITNLIIPGLNDSKNEIDEMTKWICSRLGQDVPLHFSAFHPAHKMQNVDATSPELLKMAKQIATDNGINHVFTGNIYDPEGASTYCSNCHKMVIERVNYQIESISLDAGGKCLTCQTPCPGFFF